MPKISSRVSTRLIDGLKRYQSIVTAAKSRDINESDTSRIITDILSDVFGYDRYSEITSEYSIRGTYCDLAIKLNGQPKLLIEAKAVSVDLKDTQIKQAVDYASNQGMDWVVLTNAVQWKVFKIIYGKPIDKEEVASFDFSALSPRKEDDIATLFLLAKEGLDCCALGEYYEQVRAVNGYTLAAVIQSEPVLKTIRRELGRVYPDVKIYVEDIQSVLLKDVLKREVVEAPEAREAAKKVQRGIARAEKRKIDGKELEIEATTDETKISEPSKDSQPTEAAAT